ncbi:putative toxin-antitoxin system toxin component, PIN family [Geminocystis sp. CENA526]|uniref:putative toxin-antitoxin system toxin component, PIN family n=1 Tax=Geminocystis sp. CENA526 TaxID=1355871 RepID=UPI003D6E33BC
MPHNLPKIPQCRDIFDEKFLVLAKVAKADYLVTGDKDLLSIEADFTCSIITIEQFFNDINKT